MINSSSLHSTNKLWYLFKLEGRKRIGLSILAINLFIFPMLNGQQTSVKYISSSAVIANPDRGWYDHTATHTGWTVLSTYYQRLGAEELERNRENDKITLILRLFYLHEFVNESSVSSEYLEKMQSDFDSIRSAGVKCIVRFAYSSSVDADIWDATPDKVFSHIESLRDVLADNSDVILAVQASFIGVWGEWYYTKNFAGPGYIPDDTDQENRRILVESLLDILPENICVQARTPAIMWNINQTSDPISEAEAYDGSFKSRVGHHNDCFVSSSNDWGTFVNLPEELAYLHETTKYTIAGGETCDATNQYSDCVNAVDRMIELHWTYLNRDYNQAVYRKWEDQDCIREVDVSLGYRIRLDTATMADSAAPGSFLDLSFAFINDGYAAPTQYKPIQVALIHTVTGEQTILPFSGTNDDIRYWFPGNFQVDGGVEIPPAMENGNYSLGLVFPDNFSSLAGNPAYSIQLANIGTWDSEKGLNMLNHIVSIGSGGTGELPGTPFDINAAAISESQIDLAWTDASENETGFEIMRSEGEENIWVHIASLNANTTDYCDKNLKRGTEYYYIIRSVNDFGSSPWTARIKAATLGVFVNEFHPPMMRVYPNPLDNNNLIIHFSDESTRRIVINKISGETIFETTTRQVKMQITKEYFHPGVHIISVYQSGGVMHKKLIVL